MLPSQDKLKQWVQLADEWRSDSRLIQSFKNWSQRLGKEYDVKSKLAGLRIASVQSFAVIDEVLLDEICNRLSDKGKDALSAESKTILAIADARTKTPWVDTIQGKSWRSIDTALRLFAKCSEASTCLRSMKGKDVENQIALFLADEGWWHLDRLYMELISENYVKDERISRLFIEPANTAYAEWLHEMAMEFSEAASSLSKWPPSNLRSQLDFWNVAVRKSTENKIAIFLVDALRYDICKQLVERLSASGSDAKTEPMVAMIPSITEVGMASLLPHDEKKLIISIENDQLRVHLDELDVTSRSGRINWLQSQLGSEVTVIDANHVMRSGQDELRQLIEKTRYLVVTHQDVDRAGELRPEITASFFNSIIQTLSSAIMKLHEAGMKRVVIGTDHGFLLYPEVCKPNFVEDIPSVTGLIKGRRYVVGRPSESKGVITFSIESTGLSGEGYTAVPRGLSMISMRGDVPRYVHGGLSQQEVCIAYVVSTYEKARRVKVKLDAPDPIASKIFFVNLSPVEPSSIDTAVTVRVRILSLGEIIGESEPITMCREPRRIRLELPKITESVELQLIRTETQEILDSREITVQLEGYDDLL
jgi:hypothetical protein